MPMLRRPASRFGLYLVVPLAVLALSACGDNALEDFGAVEEWIDDGRTPVVDRRGSVPVSVDPDVPRSIDTVWWYNGWEPVVASDPAQVIADVWDTSNGEDSFVQVSPNELARALPGVKIPGTLPPAAQEITSQLIFEGTTGQLDQGVVAAFGFWSTEAYSVSRATGQLGVLSVAFEQEVAPDPADSTGGCGRFVNASVCEVAEVGGHPAWWVTDIDGESLIWLDTDYRYELLRRPRLSREDVEMMANDMVPISGLAPPPAG